MRKVTEVIKKYKSAYECAKAVGTSPTQLSNLVKAGALVDERGQVWIKSKTRFKA